MLGGNEEDDNSHVFGSALNPGSLHGGKDKELAKPGVKVNAIVNNRNPTVGAKLSEKEIEELEQKKKQAGKDIWSEEEINIKAEERPDDRP